MSLHHQRDQGLIVAMLLAISDSASETRDSKMRLSTGVLLPDHRETQICEGAGICTQRLSKTLKTMRVL